MNRSCTLYHFCQVIGSDFRTTTLISSTAYFVIYCFTSQHLLWWVFGQASTNSLITKQNHIAVLVVGEVEDEDEVEADGLITSVMDLHHSRIFDFNSAVCYFIYLLVAFVALSTNLSWHATGCHRNRC